MSDLMEFANREEFRKWLYEHCMSSAGFRFVEKSEETFCPEYAGKRIHYEIVVR